MICNWTVLHYSYKMSITLDPLLFDMGTREKFLFFSLISTGFSKSISMENPLFYHQVSFINIQSHLVL